MQLNRPRLAFCLCLIALSYATVPGRCLAQRQDDALAGWLSHLERSLPSDAAGFSAYDTAPLADAASAIEQWSAHIAEQATLEGPQSPVDAVRRLLAAKASVDQRIEQLLSVRGQIATMPAGEARRNGARAFLRSMSQLIDLSGRLRYLLFDAVNVAAADDPRRQDELVDMLVEARSSIGAAALSRRLLPSTDQMSTASNMPRQSKLLQLMTAAGDIHLLPAVAALARDESTPPRLVIEAAETIRALGLPQDPRPGHADDVPPPAITATELHGLVTAIERAALSAELIARRQELADWLEQRQRHGLLGDSLRMGRFEVRPGDWLLMRNPSPYNLFTDLSPGLFTHVGVVGIETDEAGLRRMVLIDLPEIGDTMPATNVELFVLRSLHYVFVRHRDPEVGRKMGQVAVSTIGNPTLFDLNFRTDRVTALRGQPLEGKKIETYCAGLLLLCSQETGVAREELFPLPEFVAGGNTAENLAVLGLSIGRDFISPTGALFSPALEIVARREPMYEPEREIREAIYDQFAHCLETKKLVPSPDEKQALMIRMAEMAAANPLLAAALAKSQGVSADMDLVSAAKAAAVVETLDDVAYGASDGFFDARQAIRAPGLEELPALGYEPEDVERVRQFRSAHSDLYRQWQQRRLTPRGLRVALVRYYTQFGQAEIENRFFSSSPASEP